MQGLRSGTGSCLSFRNPLRIFFAGGESVLQLHMVHCIRQPVLTGLLFAAGKPAEAENYKQTGRVLTLCPFLSKEVSIREKTYRKRPAAG